MKVLHVYKDYYPVLGGIENHLKLLAERQVQRGLEVQVLVTNLTFKTTFEEIGSVRAVKAGRLATVASTPLSLSLPLWLGRLEADIVHLHFPYPLGELSYLLRGGGRKAVVTYHSDVVRQRALLKLYQPFLWRFLEKVRRIIATSPPYIQSSPYLSPFAHKCAVIPYGIDLTLFRSLDDERTEALRGRYGSPLILFVGQLRYYKGLGYLIEAMQGIQAKLLVIGQGPMEREWRALSERLGVADKVLFLGQVTSEELVRHYTASELLVLPSCQRSEAFGIVQLEAMACGRPVVSTELGTGTSYANLDGQTGLVVPPGEPAALREAIDNLLRDEALRRRLGERARERVRREFSAQMMVDKVIALYQTL